METVCICKKFAMNVLKHTVHIRISCKFFLEIIVKCLPYNI